MKEWCDYDEKVKKKERIRDLKNANRLAMFASRNTYTYALVSSWLAYVWMVTD